MNKILIFFTTVFILQVIDCQGQQLKSSEIFSQIQGLKTVGRVLYVAAHPDDENTRFIAYCANEKKLTTAYFSFTRGDGGQNLIGKELREDLGLIRTNELLMARKVDGGLQYFSRANDFGYSKNPEETFMIWNRKDVLGDLVYVIRSFQPDVIVCRFPADGRGGHGHHTASAILAKEAFHLSNDKNAYPEHLNEVSTWQAKRIVTNTGRWWNNSVSDKDSNVVKENTGTYSALQGQSCNEIAALSRSMHKSQGFGSTGTRGEQEEFFEHVDGVMARNSLFDDLDLTWNRFENSKSIIAQIDKIGKLFDINQPNESIAGLIKLYQLVDKAPKSVYQQEKLLKINELILQSAGLYLEAKTNQMEFTRGDSIHLTIELTSRLSQDFILKNIALPQFNLMNNKSLSLRKNAVNLEKISTTIPESIEWSSPYWLKESFDLGNYKLLKQSQVLEPTNGPDLYAIVELSVFNHVISRKIPILFKETDPVKGEIEQPTYLVPKVSIEFTKDIMLSTDKKVLEIEVEVTALSSSVTGKLEIIAPTGWLVKEQSSEDLRFSKANERKRLKYLLEPTSEAKSGMVKAQFVDQQGNVSSFKVSRIQYDHIPNQLHLKPAEMKLEKIDLKVSVKQIAYLMGAGDDGPEALKRMDLEVDLLNEISDLSLKKYDAVVLGVRALNTLTNASAWLEALLKYTENGGNLIIQYNTNHSLETNNFSPYSLKLSRDRITDEKAKVKILDPEHPVLNFPNLISEKDFQNWVQEFGLYFPKEWSSDFQSIIEMADPNEKSTKGALLVAQYGKGFYVYTGLSFFRQFPEGVPGAYRLFANLLSLGHE